MADLGDRFWSKVAKARENDCWEWQSWRNADGYGEFMFDGRKYKAHRLALASAGVDISGLLVRHKCDNRGCVNPKHLEVGTDADNVRDRDARNRGRWIGKKGSANPRAKLSEAEVLAIRRVHAVLPRQKSGRLLPGALKRLAQSFGIPYGTVRNIVDGYQWKHLKGGDLGRIS